MSCVCRGSRILFDEQLTLCLLLKGVNLSLEELTGNVTDVLDGDIQEVGVNTFSDTFFCHLTSDVQNILTLKQSCFERCHT